MYEIRSDIPIPAKEPNKWPFATMQVGDSITIEERETYKKASSYCHVLGAKKGFKFKTRWSAADGQGIIWRVACLLLVLCGTGRAQDYPAPPVPCCNGGYPPIQTTAPDPMGGNLAIRR